MKDKLDPRQAGFLKNYLDPKSGTFSNAYQSALKAGYRNAYAKEILTKDYYVSQNRLSVIPIGIPQNEINNDQKEKYFFYHSL